jgi:cytochrome d ubiquinol oxidase subunit II
MTESLSIGLPEITAVVLLLAFNAYALTGGADFGGGVWDLLATGPRRREQQDVISTAIAPIWEANHVWLVIMVVVCFTAFPPVFATLGTVLHVPLSLMLIGIICRGSAFMFRSSGVASGDQRRRWGLVFAIASVITPVLLGMIVGALTSGAVGAAMSQLGTQSYAETFIWPWLSPFALATGIMALAMFALLAATYLTVDSKTEPLRDDFRRRALGSAVAVFVTAVVGLVLARRFAPAIHAGLLSEQWSLPLQLATAVAALGAIWLLWRRRYGPARVAVAAQTSMILWEWGLAQYPYLVPPTQSIRSAAASNNTLAVLLALLTCGAAVLIPSLAFLLRTFVSRATEDH